MSSCRNLTLTFCTLFSTNATLTNNLGVSSTVTSNNLTVTGSQTNSGNITATSSNITTYGGRASTSFPTISPNNGTTGFQQYWNVNSGTGDTTLLALGQGGSGGWQFYSLITTSTSAVPIKLFSMFYNLISIPTSIPFTCGSISGT
jgi:hypothetical protein